MSFDFKKFDATIITPQLHSDARGMFFESYKKTDFKKNGIDLDFCQDNFSHSIQGVIRGLHYQLPPKAQGKLIMVIKGAIWDVAVDIRESSPTFKQFLSVELSAINKKMLYYIPPGFAHGFAVISDTAQVLYKCTKEYDPEFEAGIRWNDPAIGINWPISDPIISEKDRSLPFLKDAKIFE